jgi:hypothetical protein
MVASESENIIERIAAGRHTANDLGLLIRLLRDREDPKLLLTLLESTDEALVADGAYVLSEIGEAGASLLPTALSLLRHGRQDVRYWAMNSVMCCAERDIARQRIVDAGLPSDSWELTRWAAQRFLDRANPGTSHGAIHRGA